MKKPIPRLVGGLLLVALIGAGCWAWRQRRHPSPFPASQRLLLALPRPLLSRERLHRLLAPRPGERILELGPGAGYYTLGVAARLLPDGRLDALDVQPEMLDGLMRRAAAEDIGNIVPIHGDAQALPFADGSFNAVYLVAVLGEVSSPQLVLREVRRVLKPGGRLVVGEGQPDPHMIALPVLKAMAEAAELRYDRHEGGRFGYAVRFQAD